MERSAVPQFISNLSGRIFSVDFIKRTTGEARRMVCHTGVKKHLKGGDGAYSFTDNQLISVWDVERQGYRCIPLEGITGIVAGGSLITVTDL